jgi:hypothetical protein
MIIVERLFGLAGLLGGDGLGDLVVGRLPRKFQQEKTVGTMGSNEEKRRKHVIFYREFIICWDSMGISAPEVVS